MKIWKKIAALMLAAALTFGCFSYALAAVEDTGFSDVDANAWYADAVVYCRENGLMAGTSATTFNPESSLTRAMLAAVLYRVAGNPAVTGRDSFTDTVDGSWYSDAVLWASQQGLVAGYGNGLFGTNDPVTREQMTAILWRYAGSPASGSAGFNDSSAVSSYAASAVAWAGDNKIVVPVSGNTFAPKDNATRAQVASALMNYTLLQKNTVPSDNSRILVAYFSRYGNTNYDSNVDATTSASVVVSDGERQGSTEYIARLIAQQTGGDLHLIETSNVYPTDFNDVVSQNHQEIANGTRPTLSSHIDLSGYDVIFVGYPVWASTTPAPILSFLEEQNLSGKTVIPFCTHDGYGAGSSFSAVAELVPGAETMEGLSIPAAELTASADTVMSWLNGLGLAAERNETAICITIGDQKLEGVLYNSSMARQFIAQLSQTITMSNYGGREVDGGIDQPITVEGEGQLYFDDGDITYCPSNNTAAIFYSQSDRPDLTMAVYPIGKVTSDLSIFPDLPSRVEITFELAEEAS